MSVTSIDGIGRLPTGSPTADTSNPMSQTRDSTTTSTATTDPIGEQPKPPRFPWLSRLSEQLEQASNQRPPFAAAPVLGDNVNKAV